MGSGEKFRVSFAEGSAAVEWLGRGFREFMENGLGIFRLLGEEPLRKAICGRCYRSLY